MLSLDEGLALGEEEEEDTCVLAVCFRVSERAFPFKVARVSFALLFFLVSASILFCI